MVSLDRIDSNKSSATEKSVTLEMLGQMWSTALRSLITRSMVRADSPTIPGPFFFLRGKCGYVNVPYVEQLGQSYDGMKWY